MSNAKISDKVYQVNNNGVNSNGICQRSYRLKRLQQDSARIVAFVTSEITYPINPESQVTLTRPDLSV